MRDWGETISNTVASLVVGGAGWLFATLPAPPERAGGGAPSMEVSLESAAPEPPKAEPDAPKQEEAKVEPQPPPPEPPQPPPPPPQQQVEEQKQPDEPPKAPEMLVDEEGETQKLAKLQAVTQEVNSEFASCLLKKAYYPTTKEARKLKPHGLVELKVYVSDGKILAIEITKSSGSPILDATARSTVMNSACGPIVKDGVVVGALQY